MSKLLTSAVSVARNQLGKAIGESGIQVATVSRTQDRLEIFFGFAFAREGDLLIADSHAPFKPATLHWTTLA